MSLIKRFYKSFMHGPIYVIFFGLIFFGIGGGLTYRQVRFESQGAQAQGEVTGFISDCDDEGCSHSPRVRFKTQNGQTISFTSTYSSSPPAYDVGEMVTVIYAVDNPEKAIIKGEGQVLRIVFMLIGGIFIIAGLLLFGSNLRNSGLSE